MYVMVQCTPYLLSLQGYLGVLVLQKGGLGVQEIQAEHLYISPCGSVGTWSGMDMFIFPCHYLNEQNASAQETSRGRKISSSFPFAAEAGGKKGASSGECSGPPRSGTVGEEDLGVYPRPGPKVPQLGPLSVWYPACPNSVGTGRSLLDCRDPPLPQTGLILGSTIGYQIVKSKSFQGLCTSGICRGH